MAIAWRPSAITLASGVIPPWSIVAVMGLGIRRRVLRAFARHPRAPRRDQHLRAKAYGRIYGFVYSGIDTGLAIAPLVFGLSWTPVATPRSWGVALLQTMAIVAALAVGSRPVHKLPEASEATESAEVKQFV